MRIERWTWLSVAAACAMLAARPGVAAGTQEVVEVEVSAPVWRDAPAARRGGAGPDVERAAGVVANRQGGAGGQSDLSIQGSSFSGAGYMVGGAALRNPQTEHFNAELPVAAGLFGAARIVTGLEQVRAGSGQAVGAAALEFAAVEDLTRVETGAGPSGGAWQDVLVRQALGDGWGVSLFGGHARDDAIDRVGNGSSRAYGGAHVQRAGGDWQIDGAFGVSKKTFGAQGYYGTRADWPAEERLEDELAVLAARSGAETSRFVRATLVLRSTADDYTLHWTSPGVYRNRHRSDVAAGVVDGRVGLLTALDMVWRADMEAERVTSSSLGNHRRERASLLLMPEWTIGRATVSAGLRAQAFAAEAPAWLPQAGLDWRVCGDTIAYVAWSETVRQPSYTELNYNSPGSLGNQGLARQDTGAGEAGLRTGGRGWGAEAKAFAQQSHHTVDWVKATPSSSRWVATDLGTVHTWGGALAVDGSAGEALTLGASYAWLHRDYAGSYYAGRYVVDYPEHLLRLRARWQPLACWRLEYTELLRWQDEGIAARRGQARGNAGNIVLQWLAGGGEGMIVSIGCDNLWDDDYTPFVDQAGTARRFWAAVTLAWR